MNKNNPLIKDVRLTETQSLVTPQQLQSELPVTDRVAQVVYNTRRSIESILTGETNKLLVICGPCSVHDPKAGLDYAQRLLQLRQRYSDQLELVMRVYFEKPRTRTGWKGLINDPNLNDSYNVNQGLHTARQLLINIGELGLPVATEFLEPITPQYIAELVSWGCIGARTVESQVHRQMASGLSCPIGFKNTTKGSIQEAVDAIVSAQGCHTFFAVTDSGQVAVLTSSGNHACHLILRGGTEPNYSRMHIDQAAKLLENNQLCTKIMVDVSHANSQKDAGRQPVIIKDLCQQVLEGQPYLGGVMIESFIVGGNQNIANRPLTYGQSITDACISWEQTEETLELLANTWAQKTDL
ncbi:MAG: 3-deoxy-7-phosphoheptulonate synthase [Gammaproteobacteria bacterium]